MNSGLDAELTALLGTDASEVERWAVGSSTSLTYAGWTDRGNSAAVLVAVYAARAGYAGKMLMKYVPKRYRETDEPGRHKDAWDTSPGAFRADHLVPQPWPSVALADGGWLMFQEIAGRNLANVRSLSSLLHDLTAVGDPHVSPADVAEATAVMVSSALGEWNDGDLRPRHTTAARFLRGLLGHRLTDGSLFLGWARQRDLLADGGTVNSGWRVGEWSNPLALVLGPYPAADRRVYTRLGRGHGDLHPGNVLFGRALGRFWLVDLARFDLSSPLAFDPAHLLVTTAAELLPLLDSDIARAHAARLLTMPAREERSRLQPWLPGPFTRVIEAIHEAGEAWADESSVGSEWRDEILLSLVAVGLILAARREIGDRDGEWLLALAAQAAHRYADEQAPVRAATSPTPRRAEPARRSTVSTNVPAALPYAVARDGLRAAVRAHHARPGSVVAVHGPPGSGKTQLAVDYATHYGREYARVRWFVAAEPALLAARFAELAAEVGVPTGMDATRPLMVDAMRRAGRWLLIFDHVPAASDLRPFLLRAAHIDVLVTSRSPHWSQLGGRVALVGFDRAESVGLLSSMIGDDAGANELAAALDDLPAAVAQAAHFLAAGPMSADEYRRSVLADTAATMRRGSIDEYGGTLAAVWETALDQLAVDSPSAAELVTILAHFGPAPVPLAVLTTAVSAFGSAPVDTLRFVDEVVRPATRSGLVSSTTSALSCYSLLRALVRDHGTGDVRYARAMRAALVAHASGDPRAADGLQRLAPLLPHLLHADLADADDDAAHELLLATVRYLLAVADPDTALHLASAAWARWRERFGDDADSTVAALSHVAHVRFRRGEFGEAARLDEEVLARYDARYGPDDPMAMVAGRNAAASRSALGDMSASAASVEAILQRQRHILGHDHPETLRTAQNLTHELRAAGRRDEARELAQDTYRRMIHVLGDWHLDTLTCAHGLALDLRACGERDAARDLSTRVHAARLDLLGPHHPDTTQAAISVGADLRLAGEFKQALDLDRAAYEILADTLGGDHPMTLLAAHGLATDLERLGRADEAMALADGTYRCRIRVLGAGDLATLRSADLLARLHDALGRPKLAAALRTEIDRGLRLLVRPPS